MTLSVAASFIAPREVHEAKPCARELKTSPPCEPAKIAATFTNKPTMRREKFHLVLRFMASLSILLSVGCASMPVIVAPIPPHAIAVGINDGYHGVLPAIVYQQFCPAMIRTPQLSGAALSAFLAATPAGCPVLALVEAPDVAVVSAFARLDPPPPAIEIGNELELPPYELTPLQYGEWIGHAAFALAAANYQGVVVLGGVYALTRDTKLAIRFGLMNCVAFGLRCVIGVHLYDASDEDLQWLRNLHWPVWVTEVGFPTRCDPARLPMQYDWLAHQIARFSTVPQLERVFIYQRPSGSGCTDLETFGIEGKPAAALLHRWWAR